MKSAQTLANFLQRSSAGKAERSCVVLTGAGCSTESGIPDYRGPHGRYHRADFVPLTFQNFKRDDNEKRRYWARSMLGYSTMSAASCNATHMALQAFVNAGAVAHILTQNVDGLHHLATYGGVGDADEAHAYRYTTSNAPLTEIHGNIHTVICMSCGFIMPRAQLQRQLREANPSLYEMYGADKSRVRPDGDYSAPTQAVNAMRLVMCPHCGGFFKPHVVLFGENVPKPTVEVTMQVMQTKASCLLCLGTSLQVYSAYRYVVEAKRLNVPVAVVNAGKTRADPVADLKLDVESVGSVMANAAHEMLGLPASVFYRRRTVHI
ncbi:sir2-family protein-like protein [Leptomonas pyrrhocoris]|uniref:NAD-dependent protein deacylase n=1 Tax=Leptomonas pyrrhocoris TaxID=157538 RepID=A0A0N0VGR5_LEPPY|nr:sir2-family protein-like protein [Leptomonas pyrrhocoris]KPA83874.1 sir2-family protein-like protein [Leptomonas pyrrhocoris]|eukprot:XP_015662313.1 sir2-family protein-like protein [Leptomonas pyrrhocoris]